MPELELTRSREDRNLYELPDVGTLRLRGWFTKSATVQAGGRSYELTRRGIFAPVTEATDAAGSPVGEFRGRTLKRGGTLTWVGKDYSLTPASVLRERYALAAGDADRELATIESRGWGKRPVKVTAADLDAIDP